MSLYDKASLIMTPSGAKAEKLYSHKPHNGNGDFTHDRSAGTATRVNKDGYIETVAADVPRLNYPFIDGVVQDNPHFLLEPSRTNDFPYSEFNTGTDNAGFSYKSTNATVTADTTDTTSPKGDNTAAKLTTVSVGQLFDYYKNYTTESHDITFSIFVKKGSQSEFELSISGTGVSSGTGINFNVEDGTHQDISGNGDITSAFITDYGNGWYRCGITSSDSPTSSAIFRLKPSYAGTIYVWGMQLEPNSSYPTSYIPTSGTAVTRNADVCDSAGTSAEFNDSEGVLYAEAANLDTSVQSRLSLNSGNGTTNKIHIGYNPSNTKIELFIIDGSNSTVVNSQDVITDSYSKIAVNYSSSSFFGYVNGFKTSTGTARTPSGFNELSFNRGDSVVNFYGRTKELAVFKEALTDSELEALTSWTSFDEMATGQEYTIR